MEPSEGNPGGGDPVFDMNDYETPTITNCVAVDKTQQQEVLSVVLARLHVAIDALRAIADRRFPCAVCGKPHKYRVLHDEFGTTRATWSDPEDGHLYAEIPSGKFAQQVLRELEAGE